MIDTDRRLTFRQMERQTDAEREAMAQFCEELRQARAEDAQRIRAELAAIWPQKQTPSLIRTGQRNGVN